jgi:hypothetical protein
MLAAFFQKVTGIDGCASCVLVVIERDTLHCEGPGSRVSARLQQHRWWTKGEAFVSIRIVGSCFVQFPDGPSLGPFPEVEVMVNFLYAGEDRLACKRGELWTASGAGKEYERIIISPA